MCSFLERAFQPDRIYRNLAQIDFEQLYRDGIRLVLLDIDNTLVRHGSRQGDGFSAAIIATIRQVGLIPFIVSNAKPSRARQFAASLAVDFIGLAAKPSGRGLVRAMKQTGFLPEQTVMIGDQLFTDIRAARVAQVQSILVLPLDRKEVWNVGIKRVFEMPLLRKYQKNASIWLVDEQKDP